jgi:hypothetical protein
VIHAVEVDVKVEGPAIIRNRLISNLPANVNALAFLDDDDYAQPNHLQLLSEKFENADVVYSPPTGYGSGSIHEFNAKELPGRNHLGVTTLVRRSMFEKVNGFEPKAKYEDWDLWLRILKAGGRFVYVPTPTWEYRQQSDSRNHDFCTKGQPVLKKGGYATDTLTLNWWDTHKRRNGEPNNNLRSFKVQQRVHPFLGNRQPTRTINNESSGTGRR